MATDKPSTWNKCKQSLYFPRDMLEQMKHEARRQDRSLSWIVQRAWILSKEQVSTFESHKSHKDSLAEQAAKQAAELSTEERQP